MTNDIGDGISKKPMIIISIVFVLIVVATIFFVTMNEPDNNPIVGEWKFDENANNVQTPDMYMLNIQSGGTGSFETNSNEDYTINWVTINIIRPGIWINETESGNSALYSYELSEDKNILTLIDSIGENYIYSRV